MLASEERFSQVVTSFQDRVLPEPARLAGYAALMDAFDLAVPLPRTLTGISQHHRRYEQEGWRLLTPRHAPPASLEGHLVFALKHEGLDLLILKSLFKKVGPDPIAQIVVATPTGRYARRLWFLYEWLIGLNETIDFYRYFDATLHAEFLYECVQHAIEVDLPSEAKFLMASDGR